MPPITHHIPVTTGQAHHMTLRLVQSYGAPVALSDYTVYGSILQDGETIPVSVTGTDSSGILLTIPPLYPGSHLYNLHLKHNASGTDYLFLQGNCDTSELIEADPMDNRAVEQITVAMKDDLSGVTVTMQIDSETTAAAWEEIEAVARKTEGLQENISNLIPEARIEIAQATNMGKNDIAATTQTAIANITTSASETAETTISSINTASATIMETAKQDMTSFTVARQQDLETTAASGQQAISTAVTTGTGTINAAVTTGTGTINTAVANGKTSIDNYVAATQADFVRKSQANIWSGIQTFNAPVAINGTATKTTLNISGNELATQTTASLTSWVISLQIGRFFSTAPATPEYCAALSFVGGTVAAPAATNTDVRITAGFNQDTPNTVASWRIEYGPGTAIHFGASSMPAGTYQANRPYMLTSPDSGGVLWSAAQWVIVGKSYCGNALSYTLMYSPYTQDIYYAEINTPNDRVKLLMIQCTAHIYSAGDYTLRETIYTGYHPSSMTCDNTRSQSVETYRSGKRARVNGMRIYASSSGFGTIVSARNYIAPTQAYDFATGDYIDGLMREQCVRAGVRTLSVTLEDGEDIDPDIVIPAEGSTITYLLTPACSASFDARNAGGAYMQSLDTWITTSLGATAAVARQTTPVTVTVTPNLTGTTRQTWLLIGQPHTSATIIKITQPTQS